MWPRALVSATLVLSLAAVTPCAAEEKGWPPTPAAAVSAAVQDAGAAGGAALTWRYLWLGDVPAKDRDDLVRVLNFHLNELSTEPELTPLVLLPGGTVARLDALAYGKTFLKTWENLVQFEPMFHLTLTSSTDQDEYEEVPYGHYEDGQGNRTERGAAGSHFVKTETRREKTGKKVKKKVQALMSWGAVAPFPSRGGINAEPVTYTDFAGKKRETYIAAEGPGDRRDLEQLVGLTGSQTPIVEARWFLWQTAVQEDRGPAGYADFLGYDDEDDYLRITGFSAEVLKRFPLESADAVDVSSVTDRKKPRAVVVKAKAGGHLWYTLDVNQPTDKSNPLRVLDPDNFLKFNAAEVLAQLPNGLWAGGIFNDKGERQDFAPQKIAFNRFGDQNNDYNVHLGTVTCLSCHTRGGLNDIDYFVRGVLNKPPLTLNTVLDKKAEAERIRLRRLYTSDMQGYMDDDRRSVERAMFNCNQWRAEKTIAAYAREWEDGRSPVKAERFAAMLGMTREQLVGGLDRFLHSTGAVDPVLAEYLAPGEAGLVERARLARVAEGREVQYEVALEAYPICQFAVRQYSAVNPN